MENLYIETSSGRLPIKKEIVEKHHLEKGMLSPFTRSRIVGENGEFPSRVSVVKDKDGAMNGDMEATENVLLSTSEVIDFSQGEDSHSDE